VVAVVLDWDRYDLLGRIESGGAFTLNEANASDHRQAVMGVIQIGLVVVTAIVFIRWFRRAYENVEALGGERRFGAGWAIGAWFVPILNLWRPKQIANDLWRTSDPDHPNENRADAPVSSVLSLWWILFLVSNWISQVAGRIAFSGNTAHELKSSTAAFLFADAVDIIAAVLAITVVLKLTARQEQRARQRAAVT
jgi:F0F1-type ATP synthase assembly protein I